MTCSLTFGQTNQEQVDSLKNRAESDLVLQGGLANDTIPTLEDSISVNVNGFQTTVKYFAEDSIINKLVTNQTFLYGNAKIEYGRINLVAARIIIDKQKNELHATGVQDSTGAWIGLPVFKDGNDIFDTREITYNFKTQKARIIGVSKKEPDGFIRGEVIKRNPDQSAYILNGRFVPCLDNSEAGTYIKAKKIKLNPGKNVITGPFQLYVGGIPTPLGLPFGYFPDTQEATSGILFPKYGDERRRGLFLKEGGYYFAWNDYIHTALTGDIYSKGSWATRIRSVYKKRYAYSGQFDITYNRNITPETDETPLDSKDFWVSWSHAPDSRGRNARFSASVNAGTSTFNQNNLNINNFQNNIRSEFRSNINYSGVIPNSPFSYAISARHNQNVQTNIIDITLPELSLQMNRIFPFKSSDSEILKRLNVGWRMNASNRVTNLVRPGSAGFDIANKAQTTDTIDFNFNNIGALLDNAQSGVRHNIDISTSLPVLNYLTLAPSLRVEELWYFKELQYQFLENQNAVQIDTIAGFSRATTYAAGASISTQIFGTYTMGQRSKIEAIRHIINPSISFSYRPDFSNDRFGYYQNVQVDTANGGRTRLLSKFDGFRFGSPSLGEAANIGFNINNKVEMKVRNDTTKSKKVALIEGLNISGSYNFLADSFALSTINITARTSLFDNKLQVNAGATLDPYTYLPITLENGTLQLRRVNSLAISSGQGLGKLVNARLSLNTSLNSKASTGMNSNFSGGGGFSESLAVGGDGFGNEQSDEYGSINDGGNELMNNMNQYFFEPNQYVDIEVPWNVRLSLDYNYRWNATQSTTRLAIKAFGQVALTPKWQITYNSGYDFDMKELTQTSIGIYRDLGCWEMRGNWIPFGNFTSYTIDIQIKSSVLKDLKIGRRRSQFERGGINAAQ